MAKESGREPRDESASSSDDELKETKPATKTGKKGAKKDSKKKPREFPLVGKAVTFVREVVAEMRKVVWPTRRDVIKYSAITVVFVTILVGSVWGMDVGLGRLVLYLFGDPNANTEDPTVG